MAGSADHTGQDICTVHDAMKWVPWLAHLVSLILSVLWNFTLNRKYTFKSAVNVPKAMLKVALYYVVFTPLSMFWTGALTTGIWGVEGMGIHAWAVEVDIAYKRYNGIPVSEVLCFQ